MRSAQITCRTMKLHLSPHNDDESLFAAYTLIREKPTVLIISDSDMQLDRGISAAQRKASESGSWRLRMVLLRKTISGSDSLCSPNKSGTMSTLQAIEGGHL